jgi:hypothetical protein
MTEYIRFRSGAAKYRDLALMPAYLGRVDPFEPPTHVIVFDETAPPAEQWGKDDYDNVYTDVCVFRGTEFERPIFVTLSEEGQVLFHAPNEIEEDIPDAGIWKRSAKKYGYLGGVRQLGDDLFAFGYSGQVYRRNAPANWVHFDKGLLEERDDNFDVMDICRSHDGRFYAVTSGSKTGHIVVRTEGSDWANLTNPSGEWLHYCAAAADGTVWICGKNGTLLHGNAENGFKAVPTPDIHDTFLSVALYAGKVWVSTSVSLYVYDGEAVNEVDTGLFPPLRSANRLQAVDGVLWSFGYDDIVRFDGTRWERFICPAVKPFE